jgi:hypothetical protein
MAGEPAIGAVQGGELLSPGAGEQRGKGGGQMSEKNSNGWLRWDGWKYVAAVAGTLVAGVWLALTGTKTVLREHERQLDRLEIRDEQRQLQLDRIERKLDRLPGPAGRER